MHQVSVALLLAGQVVPGEGGDGGEGFPGDEQAQEVEFPALVGGGQLGACHGGDALSCGFCQEIGEAGHGIMVGEGDGGQPERLGAGDDLGGGEGAVGVGGMEVEVDGHGGSFRKCKMQNVKCKIKDGGTGETSSTTFGGPPSPQGKASRAGSAGNGIDEETADTPVGAHLRVRP